MGALAISDSNGHYYSVSYDVYECVKNILVCYHYYVWLSYDSKAYLNVSPNSRKIEFRNYFFWLSVLHTVVASFTYL